MRVRTPGARAHAGPQTRVLSIDGERHEHRSRRGVRLLTCVKDNGVQRVTGVRLHLLHVSTPKGILRWGPGSVVRTNLPKRWTTATSSGSTW